MKFTKHILSLLLLLSVLMGLCACNGVSTPPAGGSEPVVDGSPAATEPVTEPVTEEPKEQLSLDVIKDGKSDFVIVYSKLADDNTVAEAERLQDRIKKYFGVELKLSNDSTTAEHEILVGDTKREESKAAMQGLRAMDYIVKTDKSRIVVMGGTSASTKNAVTSFLEQVVYKQGRPNSTGRPMVMKTALDKTFRYNYPVPADFSIGGVPLWKFSIVYNPNSLPSEHNAFRLRELILERTGYTLDYYKDSDDDRTNEILVGNTKRTTASIEDDKFSVQVKNGKLELAYYRIHGETATYDLMKDEILKKDAKPLPADYSVTKNYADVLTGGEEMVLGKTGDLRLVVSNLQSSGANQAKRMVMLYSLFMEYRPDAIGFQEAGTNHSNPGSMQNLMKKSGVYVEAPTNASGNPVNFTPIFYNTETLELLDSGWELYDFSSPSYPEVFNNGNSKSVSWARFRVKATGKVFIFFSTHLYYKGADVGGDVARRDNVRQLTELCTRLKNEYNCPIFGGGDMNFISSSQEHTDITNNGFANARFTAEIKDTHTGSCGTEAVLNEEYDTFIKVPSVSTGSAGEIDFIFGFGSGYTFKKQNIMTDLYALYGSDHCPCMVDIKLT